MKLPLLTKQKRVAEDRAKRKLSLYNLPLWYFVNDLLPESEYICTTEWQCQWGQKAQDAQELESQAAVSHHTVQMR